MLLSYFSRRGILGVLLVFFGAGCSQQTPSYPLDQELARAAVQQAMQAWIAGQSPKNLQPEIVVGDPAWEQGEKLVAFEIVTNEETSDGSNLHIRVARQFGSSESTVTYIVGTTPVVTIFPQ